MWLPVLKWPSLEPYCFRSLNWFLLLSSFQVLVNVCPLTSLSFLTHSFWGAKVERGDFGCWYGPKLGGIQQLSEWPKTRHSWVHISVASANPRGPRGPSVEEKQTKRRKREGEKKRHNIRSWYLALNLYICLMRKLTMTLQQNIVVINPRYILVLLGSGCFVGHTLSVYVTYVVPKSRNTVQLALSYQSQILQWINLTPFSVTLRK